MVKTSDTIEREERALKLKKKYMDDMKKFYLLRDFSNLPDSTRKKIKEQIKKEFPEDDEIIKDFDIKKAKRKLEKKKTGFRMESGENASSTKL